MNLVNIFFELKTKHRWDNQLFRMVYKDKANFYLCLIHS